MDPSAFDALARLAAALRTRRAVTAGLATLPLVSGAFLPGDDAAAKPKRNAKRQRTHTHHGAVAEKKHKKHKKATYCLNGQTTQVSVSKKSKKKLKKQGAVPGACACPATCPPGQLCCGSACAAGVWANQTTFGSAGVGPSNFDTPGDVALTPDGLTAWVADYNNNRISVWTRPSASSIAWGIQKTFGSLGGETGGLQNPPSVATTADGLTALVADYRNYRVAVWKRTSATSDDWTNPVSFGTGYGSGPKQFRGPAAVALTTDGRTAVIADSSNNRVSIWTRTGANTNDWDNQTTFGTLGAGPSELKSPYGVAVTADGLLVAVADSNNHRVSIWTRGGPTAAFLPQTTFGAGVSGSAATQFSYPDKITLSPDALTAYVSDLRNNRVSIWTRPAAGSTAWAPLTTVGSGPGPGAANFDYPRGTALTPDGQTLLVADDHNNRVSVWAMVCPA